MGEVSYQMRLVRALDKGDSEAVAGDIPGKSRRRIVLQVEFVDTLPARPLR
jgi:hypothetical protein